MASCLKYKKAEPKYSFILPGIDPLENHDPDQAADGIAYYVHYFGTSAWYNRKLQYLDANTKQSRKQEGSTDGVMLKLRKRELLRHPDNHQEAKHRKHGSVRKRIEREKVPDRDRGHGS